MKYSSQILKNKSFFRRQEYSSPIALNIKYFWTLTKLSNLKLQEMVCQKY